MGDRYNGGVVGPDNPAQAGQCVPAATEEFQADGNYDKAGISPSIQTVDVVVVAGGGGGAACKGGGGGGGGVRHVQ